MLARRRLWLVAMLVLCVAVAFQVGRTLLRALADLPVVRIAHPIWLLPAVGVVVLAFAAAATGFSRLVRATGEEIAFTDAFWVTSAANMGKYLPGRVWAAAGKTLLARRSGVSLPASVVATALDVYLIVGTSVVVGGLLWAVAHASPTLGLAALAFLALLGASAHPAGFGLLSRLVPRRFPAAAASYRYRDVLEACAFYVLFWILLGLGFLFLAEALAATGSSTAIMGGFILSYFAGIAAFFAPGGIGVREGVLHHLLTPVVGAGPSALLAVGGRVWTTVAEVVVLAAASLVSMRRAAAGS
jgi:uncharacterized membrane protein YbhN (UPF0104 family)